LRKGRQRRCAKQQKQGFANDGVRRDLRRHSYRRAEALPPPCVNAMSSRRMWDLGGIENVPRYVIKI
jgi:hypothetical protein